MKKLLFCLVLLLFLPAYASEREDAMAAYDAKDYAKAMTHFLPLAEAGDGDALGNVGNMYAFGWGVAVDEKKALAYWRRAAEKHVPSAFGNIATYYMIGKGDLTPNTTEAANWYIKAAKHQHIPSMITLSEMYDAGEGVNKDKVLALAWGSLALANAHTPRMQNLARSSLEKIFEGATEKDLDEADKLKLELVKIMSANIGLYRGRPSVVAP